MLEVKCYSGHKGEEKPSKIILDNQEHFVESILRKELIEDFKTRERKTIFWCQTKDNIYKLTRLSTGEWQLAEQPQMNTRETQKKKLMPRNSKSRLSEARPKYEITKEEFAANEHE
jgi:hypothetical protein